MFSQPQRNGEGGCFRSNYDLELFTYLSNNARTQCVVGD